MQLNFVDLFAGCGGLSLGFTELGHRGLLAVEKSKDAFKTLKHNLIQGVSGKPGNFDWPAQIPIQEYEIQVLLRDYSDQLKALKGKVDVVVGGPPCQGFSTYGQREPNDVRNFLYLRYLDFVRLVYPSVVILENVEGINMPFLHKRANTNKQCKETTAYKIKKQLNKLGYSTIALRLCASDYGVPQIRPRFFIIGVRNLDQATLDTCTEDGFLNKVRTQHLSAIGLKTHAFVTVKQAISDLESFGSGVND